MRTVVPGTTLAAAVAATILVVAPAAAGGPRPGCRILDVYDGTLRP